MAKTIKGIKIEIDGSTQGLVKSLEDVNKKTGTLQSELRQVERALKFNPGNVELVAQKQKLLADQVQTTSEKLKRLKDAQADVDKQFAEGKISEKAYREFQREIVETESKLKQFESQLATSQSKLKAFGDSAVEAGQKMKDAGAKITSAGKELSTKVTAPLVGVGVIAAKIGSDFEASMSKVQSVSGATGKDLAVLTEKAREVGATTMFSASEAADALYYMALAGWDTQKMLGGIDGVMALAAASGTDLARVSDIVTDGLSAFGMQAAESGRFADVLAAASSNANTDVEGLGNAFKYVGPVAGALGYTIEDVSKAIGLMSNAGVKGEKAGTALRTMMTNLASPTKQMREEMMDLGISMTDSQGNMKTFDTLMREMRGSFAGLSESQQAASAATIFGKEAMSGALSIINASQADYEKLTGAINGSEGAAARMAEVMQDNLQGRIKEMQSALEEAAISIYNNLQPALESIVAFIQNLADWFNQLSPAAQNTIIALAGVAAAIGPILVIIGTLVASLGAVFTAIGTFSGALAVVTTGAAAATPAVGALAATITALTGPIGIAVAAIAGITAALVLAYNKVEWFRDGVNKTWDAIKSATKTAFEAVSKVISSIVEDVVKFASEQLNRFKAFWDENGKAITAIVKGYFGFIFDNIKMVMGLIQGVFQTIWPIISGVVQVAWGVIKSVVSQGINLVLGVIQTVLKLLQGDWEGAWDTIKSTAVKIVGNIVKFFQDVDLLQIGKDMIQGLIDGIGSMVDAVVTRVKSLANLIPDWIKDILGIKSPSRVMMEVGKWTGQGLADGIYSTQSIVRESIEDLGLLIKDVAENNVQQEKKIREKADADILKLRKDSTSKIADLEKKSNDRILSIQESAAKKKNGMTAAQERSILNSRSEAAKKRLKIEEETEAKIAKINEQATKDSVELITKNQKEVLEEIKLFISDKQSLEEMSLMQEAALWEKSIALFGEGTRERVEAQKAYKEATATINKEVESINEDYLSKVKDLNKQFIDEEKRLNDEYEKTLEDRTRSLYSFAGIFDEIASKEVTGSALLENLKNQVSAFEDWQKNITELAAKGIDQGLLSELREMGPRAGAEIAALNTLTNEQLQEYVGLWEERNKQAREQAAAELTELKKNTEKQVNELRTKTTEQLRLYQNEWRTSMVATKGSVKDEMAEMPNIGVFAISGLISGMLSKQGELMSAAQSLADIVTNTFQSALDIHSPSRVFKDFGININEGLIQGLKQSYSKVRQFMDSSYEVPNINRNWGVDGGLTPQSAGNAQQSVTENHYHMNFTSPKSLDPYETSRLARNAMKELSLQL